MKTFSIRTLGCKVNQYESQQIRQLLEQSGLSLAKDSEKPNLVIINTCCVTHTASAKSRQYIHRAQRLNPDAQIVVSGCLPTVQIGELKPMNNNVHIIKNRRTIAAELRQIVNGRSINPNPNFDNDLAVNHTLPQLTSFKGHTRAFLKRG